MILNLKMLLKRKKICTKYDLGWINMENKKSSIDILTESLLSKAEGNNFLNEAGVTAEHIKNIISILKNEQFSEDNRKNSRLLIDKILDEIIDQRDLKRD